MTQEVKDYATRKILESGIRMVPGHYPDFKSKAEADMWFKMVSLIRERGDGKRCKIREQIDSVRQ